VSAILDLVLGVVTSIGGFVEVGSISTSAQAGSEFGFQLLWAILVAALMLAMLTEMSGRFATISRRSLVSAVRERFGIHFQLVPLVAELLIGILLLAAEIGGAAIALRLLTGVGFVWFVVPLGLMAWLVLWICGFSVIEHGIGLLGLVTLSFIVAAWKLGPDAGDVARGLVPSLGDHDRTRYAFLAVSIMGATVSPYLLNFYSSGTIEEKLTETDLWVNTTTGYFGTAFGSIVSMGVLITSAMVLGPRHILVDSYEQAALMFVPPFGQWGIALFAMALGIGCFGAAVEITLNAGYALSQAFGWSWGANKSRREAARFTFAFTAVLVAALVVAIVGIDPLRLTMISVALTVVAMPFVVLPFLVLMNDDKFVKDHKSGPLGNGFLAALTILAALLALVVVPLQLLGG
jgi:NRAMP (natural resistance-associated macrophage protein)-like metal ion transporter